MTRYFLFFLIIWGNQIFESIRFWRIIIECIQILYPKYAIAGQSRKNIPLDFWGAFDEMLIKG